MDDRERRALGKSGGLGAADRRLCRARARSRGPRPRLRHHGAAQRMAGHRRRRARHSSPCPTSWSGRGARTRRRGARSRQGRREEGAILVLRVEGPRAIEVQHRSGQILERVNTYFGYRAVAEMRILQAPVARTSRPRQRWPNPMTTFCRLQRSSRTRACGAHCRGSAPWPAPSSRGVEARFLALARERVFQRM